MRCAVIGAGAWGTALADVLARNAHEVRLWALESEVVASVNAHHENERYLAGATLHHGVLATAELADACQGAELVVFATPSHVLRSIARDAAPAVQRDATLVVATKGVERETLAIMSDVLAEQFLLHHIVALSGPSFAAEVAARQPTAIVAASTHAESALLVQRAMSGGSFRIYTHDDVIGVEIGGALKNVIAVATGIAEGLEMGFNARAALITRGLAEMTRLGVRMGASPLTFAGLAGMGDLVLTCTGALSRNRALGVEIARGVSLDEALAHRYTVAEGVMTTHSARALAAREGVEMPIVDAVYRILFEHQPPRQGVGELMARELRAEGDA